MKARKPLLAILTAGSLLFAGTLLAQDQSVPESTAGTAAQHSAQFNTAQGQVTINSVVPPAASGPAPSFEQLSGGKRYITEEQASAYPPLANDFSYVDKGHTGHISKEQYERWANNQ
ncbi:hypothetical protein [Dyella sedimenti]|uniref:hypothetical protein n=1 Tax=Dyella sedimenti TaxID=2919947 RepID=UPI001FAA2F94|nr:hypothetical protein [Dyella sedimenti]